MKNMLQTLLKKDELQVRDKGLGHRTTLLLDTNNHYQHWLSIRQGLSAKI